MDENFFELASEFVTPGYIRVAKDGYNRHEKDIRSLMAQRRVPNHGFSDIQIESLLYRLSLMDTNNRSFHVGAGEREGRVYSKIVQRRYFGMSHGVGRSGDLCEDQPKAAGSSLMYQITKHLIRDILKLSGLKATLSVMISPVATGMTLTLTLESISRHRRNMLPLATKVIWPRIDQRTCFKCIVAAQLEVIPVDLSPLARKSVEACTPEKADLLSEMENFCEIENKMLKESHATNYMNFCNSGKFCYLRASLDDVEKAILASGGPSHVACVLSTTSCFAPRAPDDVVSISQMCKDYGIPHVVNNAYGVQSPSIMKSLDIACRVGRVDAIIQSGDKNFLVPVGGSVVYGEKSVINEIAKLYPGRAGNSTVIDLFITALSLGRQGWLNLWRERLELRELWASRLEEFATNHEEFVLEGTEAYTTSKAKLSKTAVKSKNKDTSLKETNANFINDISFALTLRTLSQTQASFLGASLFSFYGITGPKVLIPRKTVKFSNWTSDGQQDYSFRNYGTHTDELLPCSLLIMACAIGISRLEVSAFFERLEKAWIQVFKMKLTVLVSTEDPIAPI